MANIIETLEKEEIARVTEGKSYPEFSAGDTLTVNVRIKEGERERVQRFEGVCIARSGGGVNENFTVRKISFGEGVERVFPLYSPNIESIEVKRKGKVRRAKLYYLRDRRGKSARIAERTSGHGIEVRENILGKTERKRANQAAKAERKARAAEERAAVEAAKKAEADAAAAAAAEAAADAQENGGSEE